MHLHSGNILIDNETNKIKITGLENFVCDFTIKNQNYLNYAFDTYNTLNCYSSVDNPNNNDNNKLESSKGLFDEIFRNQYNIFEKLDIICFGRILYEMVTGRELNCAFPDEIEYKSMDEEIVKVLQLIFYKKASKYNLNYKMSVPEVSVKDLLKLAIFNLNVAEDEQNKNSKYLLINK